MSLCKLKTGRKIIFASNEGKFVDAQHLWADFVSRLQFDRDPFVSLILVTTNSIISTNRNDYDFEEAFSSKVQIIIKAGNIFISMTTTGNSIKILSTVKVAKDLNIHAVALTGESGDELCSICSYIKVPALDVENSQESYIMLSHIFCELAGGMYFHERPA